MSSSNSRHDTSPSQISHRGHTERSRVPTAGRTLTDASSSQSQRTPLRRLAASTFATRRAYRACCLAASVAIGLALAGCGGNSSGSSQAEARPATTPATNEQFGVIVSQSSCQENPSGGSVNCSIGVKNRGDTDGFPTVYAGYFYDDGGSSSDESDNGECRASDPIPAGHLGYIYFCHSYKALEHDVARVAVSLKIDGSYLYVRVASPDDANWPD